MKSAVDGGALRSLSCTETSSPPGPLPAPARAEPIGWMADEVMGWSPPTEPRREDPPVPTVRWGWWFAVHWNGVGVQVEVSLRWG